MKRREGFVSNSSSASFVIKRAYLTEDQVEKIVNYGETDDPELYVDDMWDIAVTRKEVRGSTIMDNFDMLYYLTEVLHIPREHICYEDGAFHGIWDEYEDNLASSESDNED